MIFCNGRCKEKRPFSLEMLRYFDLPLHDNILDSGHRITKCTRVNNQVTKTACKYFKGNNNTKMLSNTAIETRLKAVLDVPGNKLCSECEKPDNEVKYASFFKSPVDQRLLGVLCCKKCKKLHDEVGEGEFFTKCLTELDDCKFCSWNISVLFLVFFAS